MNIVTNGLNCKKIPKTNVKVTQYNDKAFPGNVSFLLYILFLAGIFSAEDGWGFNKSPYKSFADGSVKIRLWTRSDLNASTKEVDIKVGSESYIWRNWGEVNRTSLPVSLDLDKDILIVSVRTNTI